MRNGTNSMIFYIEKSYWDNNKEVFEGVEEYLQKSPRTTEVEISDHEEDGRLYKRVKLSRRNHYEFSNGSAIRFELDDGQITSYTSEEVAKFMIDAVDTMV